MGISQVFSNVIKSYQSTMPAIRIRKNPASRTIHAALPRQNAVTLGKIIATMASAPRHSLLLGCCPDGLPFLLTLRDPALGSILVSGDKDCGKTHQLQVMADSAIRMNAPRALQIAVLTSHPDEWVLFQQDPQRKKHLQEISAWYGNRAEELIKELTELTEARREGASADTAVLLMMDDFNFIEDLSYEAQVNLHWLLSYGSQSGIWPIAAIKSCYAPVFPYWIEIFRTHIIGKTESKASNNGLTQQSCSQVHQLEPGFFRVWTGKHWFTYNLPLLGD